MGGARHILILPFNHRVVPFGKKLNIVYEISENEITAESLELFAGISWKPVINYFFFGFHAAARVNYISIYL